MAEQDRPLYFITKKLTVEQAQVVTDKTVRTKFHGRVKLDDVLVMDATDAQIALVTTVMLAHHEIDRRLAKAQRAARELLMDTLTKPGPNQPRPDEFYIVPSDLWPAELLAKPAPAEAADAG